MRRAQNADTHALKQHRLSQNISPVYSSFMLVIATDMHLEPECEKRWFYTTKNIQIQATLFRYFKTNPYRLTDPFTVVRPVALKFESLSRSLSVSPPHPLLLQSALQFVFKRNRTTTEQRVHGCLHDPENDNADQRLWPDKDHLTDFVSVPCSSWKVSGHSKRLCQEVSQLVKPHRLQASTTSCPDAPTRTSIQ